MSTEAHSGERNYFSAGLRKVVLTVLIGGITYLLTNLTNAPQIWQLAFSVFIGGVVLVVQFLVEFDDRLERLEREQHVHLEEMREVVDRGLHQISEATELFAMLDAAPVRTESMTELIQHATDIPRATPRLVYDLTQAGIDQLSEFLKNLATGADVTYPGEDRDWLLALAGNAQSSIYATSMSAVDAGGMTFGGGFWKSDLGRRYLEIQRAACQRGVEIRRIFILDPREPTGDPVFEEICRYQASIGIQVRILRPTTDNKPWKNWLQDVIVFDDAVSYEMQTAPQVGAQAQPTFVNTRLVRDLGKVTKQKERFQELWKEAEPLHLDGRP